MSSERPGEAGAGFRFLFRTDRGIIDRATWWRGSVPLALTAAVATFAWEAIQPFTEDPLQRPPLVVVAAYLYLIAFGFLAILLLVCEYNLSAKRFTALRQPRSLAAVLPLSVLLAGAFAWYLPRSDGLVPQWSAWPVLLLLLGVIGWNIFALGVRGSH